MSATCTVNGYVPAVVGVPLIPPVPAFRAKPGGSDPDVIENVYGGKPPFALTACEYAMETVPFGSDPVVIVRLGVVKLAVTVAGPFMVRV